MIGQANEKLSTPLPSHGMKRWFMLATDLPFKLGTLSVRVFGMLRGRRQSVLWMAFAKELKPSLST